LGPSGNRGLNAENTSFEKNGISGRRDWEITKDKNPFLSSLKIYEGPKRDRSITKDN
jgi:hypothetical protein